MWEQWIADARAAAVSVGFPACPWRAHFRGDRTDVVHGAVHSLALQLSENVLKSVGWGTWIRTRTNGVRVRGSTVNLFPNSRPAAAGAGRHIVEFLEDANPRSHVFGI